MDGTLSFEESAAVMSKPVEISTNLVMETSPNLSVSSLAEDSDMQNIMHQLSNDSSCPSLAEELQIAIKSEALEVSDDDDEGPTPAADHNNAVNSRHARNSEGSEVHTESASIDIIKKSSSSLPSLSLSPGFKFPSIFKLKDKQVFNVLLFTSH